MSRLSRALQACHCRWLKPTGTWNLSDSGFAEASAPCDRHSGFAESLCGCLLWHCCRFGVPMLGHVCAKIESVHAPLLDFTIITGWKATMKPIFPAAIGGDPKLVHLSNALRMVDGAKPLQVGGVCKAEVHIFFAINANKPPSMPHASSPAGGLYMASTLNHCHRRHHSKLPATPLPHAHRTGWAFANSLHHPCANSVMFGYCGYQRLFIVKPRHNQHFAYN
ncbi:uncharacterized protein LACBIDRAFT_330158 [Laccaria bicolor S238N-H82]|uniref:Predicted protein n=1 Tax=Laccaria bicolor (strain S238N-H82 / ATCC MYA-4686) TaxID=486041 RepID=B0DKH2_LACBS|nr:uncharacterized protein LACBIDRAFT_330158 [Laccaria bicolor S238N-H82]EDR05064.1 predicted protein [Laccaria bicolor S238N-H82]|eukprot:XP_001884454.1 predicted protein [Laccaria bicolor S238N-H82]